MEGGGNTRSGTVSDSSPTEGSHKGSEATDGGTPVAESESVNNTQTNTDRKTFLMLDKLAELRLLQGSSLQWIDRLDVTPDISVKVKDVNDDFEIEPAITSLARAAVEEGIKRLPQEGGRWSIAALKGKSDVARIKTIQRQGNRIAVTVNRGKNNTTPRNADTPEIGEETKEATSAVADDKIEGGAAPKNSGVQKNGGGKQAPPVTNAKRQSAGPGGSIDPKWEGMLISEGGREVAENNKRKRAERYQRPLPKGARGGGQGKKGNQDGEEDPTKKKRRRKNKVNRPGKKRRQQQHKST